MFHDVMHLTGCCISRNELQPSVRPEGERRKQRQEGGRAARRIACVKSAWMQLPLTAF